MRYDVVIIGSGFGGLVCAHLLAKAGKRVLVLERQLQPGGCIQSYQRKGQAFDTGLHYVGGLGEGQKVNRIFSHLGLMRLPWHRLDPKGFDLVTIGEETFAFAEGYDQFVDKLATRFPKEREALQQYVQTLQQTEAVAFGSNDAYQLFGTCAYDYLTRTFNDPLLINVIDDIHSFGGEVICQAEVDELIEKDGRIIAAHSTNGETYEGDIFISDIYPSLTFSLVKDSAVLRNLFRRRMSNMENTFGIFTASLMLKPDTLPYFNHNQFVYRQPNVWTFYEEPGSVGGLMISCRVPEEGTYATQIDLLTPMPWRVCEPWAETQIGRRGADYLALKARYADECITLAETVIPGLREMISQTYTSTPLTYRDYTLTPNGSAYGVRRDCRNLVITMLSPRTPIPNLMLTGQNLMLHGLEGVSMTALLTCQEFLGTEYIKKIVTE